MRYVVILENAGKNWCAYVPRLLGCVSVGDSREEARRNIAEAIGLFLEASPKDWTCPPPPGGHQVPPGGFMSWVEYPMAGRKRA